MYCVCMLILSEMLSAFHVAVYRCVSSFYCTALLHYSIAMLYCTLYSFIQAEIEPLNYVKSQSLELLHFIGL